MQRRAGSGTYITDGAGTKAGLLFGLLIPSLIELNYQIPKHVRIVGIDDVQYASLLPVPRHDLSSAVPRDRLSSGCDDVGADRLAGHARTRHPAELQAGGADILRSPRCCR